MLRKVLIANRGEIAVRVSRTLRELGIGVVSVFTKPDRASLHVSASDEAVSLGDDPRAYLDIERIIGAARKSGADALHPGYGFLAESAELAQACEGAGLTFIGPPPSAIAAMGNKRRARALMSDAGVPVVPGGDVDTPEQAREVAQKIGFPLLIKPSAGGGGKGMRRVESESELLPALERAVSEAESAFGSGEIHLERALARPRHIEVQILGDRHGNLIHLHQRDCSLQRRHQKVVEEAPGAGLDPALLDRMNQVALRGARAIGYYSAGTFEFLLDASGAFFFLEMNTRLQVEHPVTELLTGVDLVRAMVEIAAGERGPDRPPEVRGAAIEARLYAEDPEHDFLPSPGTIQVLREPGGPFVRVDSGVEEGSVVGPDYDPLLAKVSVWAEDRPRALSRLGRALDETVITGLKTNLGFLQRLCRHPDFTRGVYDTELLERNPELKTAPPLDPAERDRLRAALSVMAVSDGPRALEPFAEREALSPWVLAERARLGQGGGG